MVELRCPDNSNHDPRRVHEPWPPPFFRLLAAASASASRFLLNSSGTLSGYTTCPSSGSKPHRFVIDSRMIHVPFPDLVSVNQYLDTPSENVLRFTPNRVTLSTGDFIGEYLFVIFLLTSLRRQRCRGGKAEICDDLKTTCCCQLTADSNVQGFEFNRWAPCLGILS